MTPIAKPTPLPNDVSRPYWEAAAQGQLVLQRCADCHTVRNYPRLMCAVCYSTAVNWLPASGRGVVHSWTVAHHAFHPAFAADLPYTLVTIDLAEGVRALGRWRGDAVPVIDQAVVGGFVAREGGVDLVFGPVAA